MPCRRALITHQTQPSEETDDTHGKATVTGLLYEYARSSLKIIHARLRRSHSQSTKDKARDEIKMGSLQIHNVLCYEPGSCPFRQTMKGAGRRCYFNVVPDSGFVEEPFVEFLSVAVSVPVDSEELAEVSEPFCFFPPLLKVWPLLPLGF